MYKLLTYVYKRVTVYLAEIDVLHHILFISYISCGSRLYLCACTSLCNLPSMKKICVHNGKFRTLRVITATLRNGRVAVASGGLNWAGKKGGRNFLWFSCWFPRRPAWTRIMLSARYRTQYQMPAYKDRYTMLLLRPETGIVYSKKKGWWEESFRIARFEITDAANPTLFI